LHETVVREVVVGVSVLLLSDDDPLIVTGTGDDCCVDDVLLLICAFAIANSVSTMHDNGAIIFSDGGFLKRGTVARHGTSTQRQMTVESRSVFVCFVQFAADTNAKIATIDAIVACDPLDSSVSNGSPLVVTDTRSSPTQSRRGVPLAVASSLPIGTHLSHDGHTDSTLTALVPDGHAPQLTVLIGGHSGV
jgi:hypothetical protein